MFTDSLKFRISSISSLLNINWVRDKFIREDFVKFDIVVINNSSIHLIRKQFTSVIPLLSTLRLTAVLASKGETSVPPRER